MALFGDSVPREWLDDMRRQRDDAQQELRAFREQYTGVVTELVAVKRHDLGMPPAGFTPSAPWKLGKKTRAAIEEMSRGYPDLVGHNTNWALTEAMKVDDPESDEFDAALAQRIYEGDPG